MFQGTITVDHSHEDLYTLLNHVISYNLKPGTEQCKLITKLKIRDLKISAKGNLGHYLYTWDLSDRLQITDEDYENIGSIHFTCRTQPGDLNISLLYFVISKKLKVSGKLLDVHLAGGLGQDYVENSCVNEAINTGLQLYMNDIQTCCFTMFGSNTENSYDFAPSLMNGMFDIRKKIQNINNMSTFFTNYPFIQYAEGQEPELNGRIFSIKLIFDNKVKLILDHTGKIQIFSAKSYNMMLDTQKKFMEYLDLCVVNNIVHLQDIVEYSHAYIAKKNKQIKLLKPKAFFF